MTIPNAIPTEYKGVVYRSKSEAMFARWLELTRCTITGEFSVAVKEPSNATCVDASGWIYEPQGFSVDGWCPDFLHWRVVAFAPNPVTRLQIPVLVYDLIEYKPSRPTQTYCERFVKNAEAILQRTAFCDDFTGRCSIDLYFGSVYNESCGVLRTMPAPDGSLHSWTEEVNWIGPHAEEIRNTRFDLES